MQCLQAGNCKPYIPTNEKRVHGKTLYKTAIEHQKYKVLDEIGRGGFSTLYTVRPAASDKVLVCKAIPKPSSQFQQEILSMARMFGNGAIPLRDFYEDEKNYYIIMDRGHKDVHETHVSSSAFGSPVSEDDVRQIIRQTLITLCKAHRQGILHLDIKAGNLMWLDESQKRLVLIDWGLSTFLRDPDSTVDMHNFSGTPWFMAPEQLRSETSAKSDVWAVGVLTAQLLLGRFPFNDRSSPNAPSVNAIWRSILTEEFKPSSRLSPDANSFIASLLTKDPQQRPSARKALDHPWLIASPSPSPSPSTSAAFALPPGSSPLPSPEQLESARRQRLIGLGPILETCIRRVASANGISPLLLSSTPGREWRRSDKSRSYTRRLFDLIDQDGDGLLSPNDLEDMIFSNKVSTKDVVSSTSPVFISAAIQRMNAESGITYEAFESMVLASPDLPAEFYLEN